MLEHAAANGVLGERLPTTSLGIATDAGFSDFSIFTDRSVLLMFASSRITPDRHAKHKSPLLSFHAHRRSRSPMLSSGSSVSPPHLWCKVKTKLNTPVSLRVLLLAQDRVTQSRNFWPATSSTSPGKSYVCAASRREC